MDGGILQPSPGDPKLIEDVVNRLKSQGIFDNLRKECLADVDTKVCIQKCTTWPAMYHVYHVYMKNNSFLKNNLHKIKNPVHRQALTQIRPMKLDY
jgi:hypothetical protein